MGQPVVHFEIIGADPESLRAYYGELFGWELDSSSPVSDAVSEPNSYGFVQHDASSVGGGSGYDPHTIFYVGVPDVEAALQRAEHLGGTRRLGPEQSPSGLVIGHFSDPEGNLIGVAGPA